MLLAPVWGTAYTSKVNRAKNIKSDAQVATNKNSDPVQKYFSLGVAGEDENPNSNFFKLPELSETSRVRKLILGLGLI